MIKRMLSDDVENIIKKMILEGKLKPGERINQAQIAEQLEISRGPVREALKLLQKEGLIKNVANIGAFVTTLSKKDIFEIYSLRGLLEGEASQLALPNLNGTVLNKLNDLVVKIDEAAVNHDLGHLAEYDMLFHREIVECSKHDRLINMHKQLDTQIGAMFLTVASKTPFRIKKQKEHHQNLIDTLFTNDRQKVKESFTNHYLETLEDLLKMFNE